MKFKRTSLGNTSFVTLPNDTFVGKSIEIYGEWSYGEIELLARLLPKNSNVVEVGANIGAHSVFIARDICSQGRLYAFEPRRIFFQMLCTNLILNDVSNAHCFQKGAGDRLEMFKEGVVKGGQPINAGAFAIGKIPGDEEKIIIEPLDGMLDELPSIALIKADVEGYEINVLKGAQRLIERDRPILYVENDRVEFSERLLQCLFDMQYDCWFHIVPLFRENNTGLSSVNIFGAVASFNMLCFPKEQKVTDKALADKNIPLINLYRVTDASIHPLKREATTPVNLNFKDVGRNDLCPCGSGQKYKRCHGK